MGVIFSRTFLENRLRICSKSTKMRFSERENVKRVPFSGRYFEIKTYKGKYKE